MTASATASPTSAPPLAVESGVLMASPGAALQVARWMMFVAIFIWAIWTGGQTFHLQRVIPIWSADPPQSLLQYSEISRDARILPFFLYFSTVWPAALATAAAALSWRLAWRDRGLIVLFALVASAISAVLILWMAPTIGTVFQTMPDAPAEATRQFRRWERANVTRLCVEWLNLLIGMRALIGTYRPRLTSTPPAR